MKIRNQAQCIPAPHAQTISTCWVEQHMYVYSSSNSEHEAYLHKK